MLRILLLLLVLLGAPAPLPAQVQAAVEAALEDGPYVLWKGQDARVLQVKEGRLLDTTRNGAFDLDLPGLAPGSLRLVPKPPVSDPAEYPLPPKILAVSDVHGNLRALLNLFKAHGVLDAALRWSFGRGHVVVVGDVFDRGPNSTEIFWLIRSLEAQALKAGGRVHMLLGNHEAMVLKGDLRYLHVKYQKLLRGTLPLSMPELYGPESELGRWLRTRSTLLRLGPYLFVHGGISPAFTSQGFTIERANALIRKGLDAREADDGTAFLMGSQGPLWYRGLVPRPMSFDYLPDATLEAMLKSLGARTVVIGHTPHARLQSFHGGRVYAIDAGILEGLPGEAWICEGGKLFKGLADGSREPLVP